jgi:hypothetical protein
MRNGVWDSRQSVMQFTEFTLESGKSFLAKGCKEETLMGFVALIPDK